MERVGRVGLDDVEAGAVLVQDELVACETGRGGHAHRGVRRLGLLVQMLMLRGYGSR